MPFILFFMFISLTQILRQKEIRTNKRKLIQKIGIIALPVIILTIVNHTISFMNHKNYGMYTTNEINDSAFTETMKAIYSVKDEEEIEYVSVSRAKLEKIYAVSPTMNELKENLNQGIDLYKTADRKPEDNEVEDGWFFWCLRYATESAGYYDTPQHANEIYQKIADEINIALEDGRLEKQTGIMPSALMSPWKKGYFSKLLLTFGKAMHHVFSFQDISVEAVESVTDGAEGIALFEAITNNNAIHPEDNNATISKENANAYTKRIQTIVKVYQRLGIFLLILGIVAVIAILVWTIQEILKKKYEMLQALLLLCGIGGSLMVLLTGVSYTEITAFASIHVLYLVGAYPLAILLWAIAIGVCTEKIMHKIKE